MNVGDDDLLTISAIAQRSGVNASALRYYETLGLIESVRSNAGHRRYRRSSLRRIAYILFAQKIGFSLDEISAQLVGLPIHHAPSPKDWEGISKTWVARVDARIAELTSMRRSLENCIGCGCLSLKQCAIYNREDTLARNGAGPRVWLGDKVTPYVEADGADGSACAQG